MMALNDLTGPSAGPLAQTPYSIPFQKVRCFYKLQVDPTSTVLELHQLPGASQMASTCHLSYEVEVF